MDTQTIILISIVVVVVLVAGLVAWFALRLTRSRRLRDKYGAEYDYTLENTGDQRAAEEILLEREKRMKKITIQALDSEKVDQYRADWDEIQADFVDEPAASVEQANQLITEVMIARGFPVEDFEQRAADLSVLYPDFVINYRNAYAIVERSQHNGISTEDLRQAMVYYRSMFDELLETERVKAAEDTKEKEAVIS